MELDFSPAVLRNKGVPIRLYKRANGESILDENGEAMIVDRYIRMTANEVSILEEIFDGIILREKVPHLDASGAPILDASGQPLWPHYTVREEAVYGADAFATALDQYATKTVRKVLSLCLGVEEEIIGSMMVSELASEYRLAINMAWMLANGVSAEVISKTMASSTKALREEKAKAEIQVEAELAKLEEQIDGLGETGSKSGSSPTKRAASAKASTTSGA